MNFYTFFKSQSKSDCEYFNFEYPEYPSSLWHFRKSLLISAFHRPMPLSVFQRACFKSVPLDMPIKDYETLYDYFFRKSDDLNESLIKIAHSLKSTIFDILFDEEVS